MIRNGRERRSRLSARPFGVLASRSVLSANAVQELTEVGFIVIPGPVEHDGPEALAGAYDCMVWLC